MPKYVRLYRVRLTRDGYIMKGDRFAGQYRGVDLFRGGNARKLYRMEDPETGLWQEFRCVRRAEAVIEARGWLAQFHPYLDVRS